MIRKVIFIVSLLLLDGVYALDIGLDAGVSSFNYAEVGPNNKDDLYTISSSLVGVNVIADLSLFKLKSSLRTQVPFSLRFSDALGGDDTNYLEMLLFFGGHLQFSLLYPFIDNRFSILAGPLLHYDFFYFEDYMNGMDSKYFYSVIGGGLCLDLRFTITSCFSFTLCGTGVYDFLPTGVREGRLLWATNVMVTTGLIYSFK